LIVNIGRTDAFLPRSEQIPGETHQIGDRIRALIFEVRELPNQVKIVLSRAQEEFIQRLFEIEVPEVAERVIEIRAMAREPGYRTKVAVSSIDSKVDAVGACVGVRGSRIKNIVDELNNEKIDIVRWNESSQILIQNALKPAEVDEISLCLELGKATVVVKEDQLSLAIGKRGQNVRLAARLTGWDINITTPEQHTKALELIASCLRAVEGVDELLIDKIIALGSASVQDIDDLGPEPIIEALEIDADLAERICEAAGEETIRILEEKEAADKLAAAERAAGPKPPAAPSAFVAEEGGDPAPADQTLDTSATTAEEGVPASDQVSDAAGPAGDASVESPAPSAFVADAVDESKTPASDSN
ncbi:MAG: transcription termination factor NusA, partial [Phycisphaerales bacterium]|nr:transcription termination factor NusA [Phycisphaerales bacterium]